LFRAEEGNSLNKTRPPFLRRRRGRFNLWRLHGRLLHHRRRHDYFSRGRRLLHGRPRRCFSPGRHWLGCDGRHFSGGRGLDSRGSHGDFGGGQRCGFSPGRHCLGRGERHLDDRHRPDSRGRRRNRCRALGDRRLSLYRRSGCPGRRWRGSLWGAGSRHTRLGFLCHSRGSGPPVCGLGRRRSCDGQRGATLTAAGCASTCGVDSTLSGDSRRSE